MSYPPAGSDEPTLRAGAAQPPYGGAPTSPPYGGVPAQPPYGGAPDRPPAQGGHPGPADPPGQPGYGGGVPTVGGFVPGLAPAPGAQMSGPPYGQQMSGPPYGQQMSGPPYGQQMSAPPGSGTPYGSPTPGTGGPARRFLVLAVVAGLLFVISGVMTGLFVTKTNEANRTEKRLTAQVAERNGTIDANTKEIESLKRDLQAANDKIKSIDQDLTGTKNDRDEQQHQKEVIATCLDLLTKAFSADTRAEFDKAIKAADKPCTEADKYL